MSPRRIRSSTPNDNGRESLLRRGAVGFWLCGVGALGLLRAGMRIQREGAFPADVVGMLWLFGSMVVVLAGIALVVRAARH